jgi:ABC-type glycerol-3-phosphate transport system substrate-binding protein
MRASTHSSGTLRSLGLGTLVLLGLALVLLVLNRAGMTHRLFGSATGRLQGEVPRKIIRVWDWWAPSGNERYGTYFADVEREWERLHPDTDIVFQFVPYNNYEQKMATGLSGASPPDVFQCSVTWGEGFYDRGMLLPLNAFLERERAEREVRKAKGLPIDPGEIIEREAFYEPAWRHNAKPDGTVFGIPHILDANCLIWNLDHLRAAGDDPDIRSMFDRKPDGTPDWDRLRWDAVKDWAQFRRITRRLSRYDANGQLKLDADGEPEQAGFTIHAHASGSGPIMPWLAANGTNFQDVNGTRALFGEPAGQEAIQFVLDLYWKDRVSPAFRRQLTDDDVFIGGKVSCLSSGTWAGKNVVRNTEGKLRFDNTAYPPGPRGKGSSTATWANYLVIPRSARNPELAWEFIKFTASLKGSLRLLKHIHQNSPRFDFYRSPEWDQMVQQYPYLRNSPQICASGVKRYHTQINAVEATVRPIFETILLRYPQIEAGRGPYPSAEAGVNAAAAAVNRIYDRYNAHVARWEAERSR